MIFKRLTNELVAVAIEKNRPAIHATLKELCKDKVPDGCFIQFEIKRGWWSDKMYVEFNIFTPTKDNAFEAT